MKTYTATVDATFSFDVIAASEAEALEKAKALLNSYDPINDWGGVDTNFSAPWVTPERTEDGFPSLKIADVFPVEDL